MAEIVAKLDEMATIDRIIEKEALCSLSEPGKGEHPDFSMFKAETERLLIAFWNAPNRFLSQEDIREEVILDEEASERAVRQVIVRARKAIREMNFCYEIKNLREKGYRLVNREMLQCLCSKFSKAREG